MSYELPMFPLGLVAVPGQIIPLHIFEPRYRALIEHCVERADTAEGPTFGIVLIRQGSEVGGGDVRHDVGTSTRIVKLGRYPDGRFALETLGTHRVVVRQWYGDDPYPRALIDDLDEEPWPDDAALAHSIVAATAKLRRVLAMAAEACHDVGPATFDVPSDHVAASYVLAARAPLATPDHQRLLAAGGPVDRVAWLVGMLDGWEATLAL